MITLTLDKFVLVKAGFSIRDPIHEGLGRSTPKQMACLAYTVRWDGTMPVRGLCTLTCQP
jgi:hypothetical protein